MNNKLGPERQKLKERLEQIKEDVQPYPELEHILRRINNAIDDLIEPEGMNCARVVLRDSQAALDEVPNSDAWADEEKAPDTLRSPYSYPMPETSFILPKDYE